MGFNLKQENSVIRTLGQYVILLFISTVQINNF